MRRVLLDENMARKLRPALAEFRPATVQYMGWSRLTNGELLDKAESSGFDAFLTGDKSVEFEQNMKRRKIAVVSLSAPHWPIIRPHVAKIVAAVGAARPGEITRVECGTFRRGGKPSTPGLG